MHNSTKTILHFAFVVPNVSFSRWKPVNFREHEEQGQSRSCQRRSLQTRQLQPGLRGKGSPAAPYWEGPERRCAEMLLPRLCSPVLSRYQWDDPCVTRVAGHLQLRKDVLLQVKLVRKQNNLTRTPSFIHTLGRPLRFIYLWLYWITECSTSPNTDNFFLTILFFYRKLSWEVSQCKNPFLKVNLFYSRVKELPAV